MHRDRAVRVPDRVFAAVSPGGHVPAGGDPEEAEIGIRYQQQERKLGTSTARDIVLITRGISRFFFI